LNLAPSNVTYSKSTIHLQDASLPLFGGARSWRRLAQAERSAQHGGRTARCAAVRPGHYGGPVRQLPRPASRDAVRGARIGQCGATLTAGAPLARAGAALCSSAPPKPPSLSNARPATCTNPRRTSARTDAPHWRAPPRSVRLRPTRLTASMPSTCPARAVPCSPSCGVERRQAMQHAVPYTRPCLQRAGGPGRAG
jgi:hypothetical protein